MSPRPADHQPAVYQQTVSESTLASVLFELQGLRHDVSAVGDRVTDIGGVLTEHVTAERAWQIRTESMIGEIRRKSDDTEKQVAEHAPTVQDARDTIFGAKVLARAAVVLAGIGGAAWGAGNALSQAVDWIRHTGR